jgi:TPR repeat protein
VSAPVSESNWRAAALAMMKPEELRELLGANPQNSAPWIEAAASAGLPVAQLQLGRMLLQGLGVECDRRAAYEWFLRAAQAGKFEAANMVGRCHENGWGVAASSALAAIWYSRAAKAGDAWAQYNLGHLLLDGNGVEQDRAAAFHWYFCAAAQGHARAMNLVARCCEEGWGTPRDRQAARTWYRRSARGGYFRGAFNYATILLGEGCIVGARHWLRRAFSAATPEAIRAMRRGIAQTLIPHSPEIASMVLSVLEFPSANTLNPRALRPLNSCGSNLMAQLETMVRHAQVKKRFARTELMPATRTPS